MTFHNHTLCETSCARMVHCIRTSVYHEVFFGYKFSSRWLDRKLQIIVFSWTVQEVSFLHSARIGRLFKDLDLFWFSFKLEFDMKSYREFLDNFVDNLLANYISDQIWVKVFVLNFIISYKCWRSQDWFFGVSVCKIKLHF